VRPHIAGGRGIHDGIDVPIVFAVGSQIEIRRAILDISHRRHHKGASHHVTTSGHLCHGEVSRSEESGSYVALTPVIIDLKGDRRG
jgi:hypothetical protein